MRIQAFQHRTSIIFISIVLLFIQCNLFAQGVPEPKVIYVSSSQGDDNSLGISPRQPVKSIQKALRIMRDGTGDQLLLKRGDVFQTGTITWTASGFSPEQPAVFGAYGQGNIPIVKTGADAAVVTPPKPSPTMHYVQIRDIAFIADKRIPEYSTFDVKVIDSDHAVGIVWRKPGSHITIQNCLIRGYREGMVIGPAHPGSRLNHVTIRGNRVLDSYGKDRSQGMYIHSTNHVLIENNLFDHNGWHPVYGGGRNMFNHSIYVQHNNGPDFIVRGNVFSRTSSHGIQMRSGGVAENNIFYRNSLDLFIAGHGVARGNIMLEGQQIADGLAGAWSIQLINSGDDSVIEGNIIAHAKTQSMTPRAIDFSDGTLVRNNVIVDWHPAIRSDRGDNNISGAVVENNTIIMNNPSNGPLIMVNATPESAIWRNNRYEVPDNQQWARTLVGEINREQWRTRFEPTAVYGPIDLPDPNATLDEALIGQLRDATPDEFVALRDAAFHRLRTAYGFVDESPAPTPNPNPAPSDPDLIAAIESLKAKVEVLTGRVDRLEGNKYQITLTPVNE